MPVIIVAILGIALVLYVRKRNMDEIRRIQEDSARESALYEQRLEREAQEIENRCAGKPVEEQVKIREEFCARLEADMKRCQGRVREIERQRKAAERAKAASHGMSPGTQGALLFMAGAAVGSMGKKRGDCCGTSGRKDRSRGCGCTCEACLEGRHEDCHDDCELW
ncbi:MAG: hypothetical protein ACOX6W_02705 [Lentisphaeria bacterium]|jgi:hypothetical protein